LLPTASRKALRRTLYDKIASLGPGTIGRQRSGGLTLSMIDGVEQLDHAVVRIPSAVMVPSSLRNAVTRTA
jgi:ABC-type transport system involved in cytochrome bd biosynthesis fused ATPase/permease subunit